MSCFDDDDGGQYAEENARANEWRNEISRRNQEITELFKKLSSEEKTEQLKSALENIKILAWEDFDAITKIVEAMFTLGAIMDNVKYFVFKEGEDGGDENTCKWKLGAEFEDVYETSCGEMQYFASDGIIENHYKFCPYCGKQIEEMKNGN